MWRNNEQIINKSKRNWNNLFPSSILLLFMMTSFFVIHQMANAETTDIERVSLGTGSVQSNGESYYLSLSEDA